MLLHISSSYAIIFGETNFHTGEFPRSGSKAKDGEKEERKKERLNDGNNNGQLRIANATLTPNLYESIGILHGDGVQKSVSHPRRWDRHSGADGLRSVTAAWATRSPWSILVSCQQLTVSISLTPPSLPVSVC